jgi:hypothetical protein
MLERTMLRASASREAWLRSEDEAGSLAAAPALER